jgi:hypothetical protein
MSIAAALCGLIVLANVFNSTLMCDDGYFVHHFPLLLQRNGPGRTVWIIFLNLDIARNEYRLYGLSRLIHLTLWSMFGSHAWAYAGVIGAAQAVSALGIYRVLRRFHADAIQSGAVALAWGFPFFASTTVLIHWAYTVLPYELAIGCALILQKQRDQPRRWLWRLLAAAICMAIAWTGEEHLLAAMVILVIVALATPSARAARGRWVDAAVPLVAIPAAVGLHRSVWLMLARGHMTHPRYVFAIPTAQQFLDRSAMFLVALYNGAAVQVRAVFTFPGPWIWAFFGGAGLAAAGLSLLWYRGSCLKNWGTVGDRRNCRVALSVPLASILLASLGVLWALAVFSGQIAPVMPRRYGYVPYSLVTIVVLAFLTDPWMRRKAGMIPALVACVAAVLPWVVLQGVCLPVVRAEDGRVWAAARTAMAGKADSLLFITAWNHPDMPGFQLGAGTPGLRGPDFPSVFESPLDSYWWESLYAQVALGARYVGYRAVPEGPGRVRLFGNGLLAEESALIPTGSLVVLADLGLDPPRPGAGVGRIVSLTTWDAYRSSLAAHPVALQSGWNGLLDLTPSQASTIGLGQKSPTVALLPDKRFSDPPRQDGLIENYGLESGADDVFPAAPQPRPEPLAYFLSNRHGDYTYRIDFNDRRPKWVILDLLDLWHVNAGERLMKVEAALDGQWFLVGTIDPAAEAGRTPLQIKFPIAGVKSFRIRLTKALVGADVPFLNGIRVLPVADDSPPRVLGTEWVHADAPESDAIVSGTVTISGWALDNTSDRGTPIGNVRILVDGVPAGNATYGLNRPDVCVAFRNRPGCPNVGFSFRLNTTPLKQGPHRIAISATDSDPTPHTETAILPVTVR